MKISGCYLLKMNIYKAHLKFTTYFWEPETTIPSSAPTYGNDFFFFLNF